MLVKNPDGRYISSPAFSSEHGSITAGNIYEQTLIWQLFNDTIAAAKLLGKDRNLIDGAGDQDGWQTILEHLDPIRIDGNYGYPSGASEMLMQSNMGYLNLLPALPVDGRTARCKAFWDGATVKFP